MKVLAKIIATALGSGYAPYAPGTVGTLMGILMIVFINFITSLLGYADYFQWVLIVSIISAFVKGLWSTRMLENEWGHDPGKIVIDEVVGIWITILFIPFTWINLATAFVIFRIFDIAKPLGIKSIDKQKTPLSVMLDDVLAGVYSWIVLRVILYMM